MSETNLTITDRLAQSFFGGLTGAIYGVILWVFASYFTGKLHASLIACSAFVFASLGVFFGNFIVDTLLVLLHFLWGLLSGLAENWPISKNESTESHLHSFFLFGFGTGLVILIWWYS